MAYTPSVFVNNSSTVPIDATNLNRHENETSRISGLFPLQTISYGDATITAAKISGLTSTIAELNTVHSSGVTNADLIKLHALAATSTELNYVDGVTSAIQTQIDNISKVSLSNYTGTGVYGSSNKNSVVFSFVPRLVLVTNRTAGGAQYGGVMIVLGQPTKAMSVNYYTGSACYVQNQTVSWSVDLKTIYWYSNTSADIQLNMSGQIYDVLAIS